MIQPVPHPDWPESYAQSYANDLVEVFGRGSDPHHAALYRNRLERVLDVVATYGVPGASILDLAAAQGNYTLLLGERGYKVTWNDIRAELAEYVKLKYERGDVTYSAGDAFEIRFPESFDAVLALEIIEHVAHPDEFLKQVARLVKPGGLLVLSTPNGGYFRHTGPRFSRCSDPSVYEAEQFKPDADGHIFCLTPGEFRQLSQAAGLELIEAVLFNTVSTMGHCKLRHLHLPAWLLRAVEDGIRYAPARIRELVCAASLYVCRRLA